MIKGNESHVEDLEIFTPLSGKLKMLHFDATPIESDIVTEL